MRRIPGITACIGADPRAAAPAAAGAEGGLREESFQGRTLRGLVRHHGTFHPKAVYRDDESGVVLAVDGWVLPPAGWPPESGAQGWLAAYLREGISFVEKLNGAFNLIVWDDRKGTVHAANDRYGLRPIHHASMDGRHYLAPDARSILDLAGRRPALNEAALYNLLSYSRMVAGQETYFQGIRSLPPATILEWKDGAFSERRYWDYPFNPADGADDAFVDSVVAAFKTAVDRHLRPWKRLGINLSGGLDSRALAAALPADLRRRTKSFTWGYSDRCEEVALARRTAEVLDIPWNFVRLAPGDFLKHAGAGARIMEGRDLAVQSYGLEAYPKVAAECDVSVAGLAFDLLCGGSYSSQVVDEKIDLAGEGAGKFLDKFFYFRKQSEEMFLDRDAAMAMIGRVRGQLLEDMGLHAKDHPANVADRFALKQRVWRYIFPRQAWQRLEVEDVVPTFDNDLVDLLLKLPPEARANHGFYRRFLARLDPRCMDIPYQRTLLPPSVPVKYWEAAAKLESDREALLRRIYFETGGATYIPYDRYYSNFDEWLRVDPAWISAVDSLLLSPESRLCAGFLRRDWVKKLVDEQRSGQAAHYSRLVVLLTAETFLRECL